MIDYTVKQIAQIVEGSLVGNGEARINEVIIDSRTPYIHKNQLFVAIQGPRHDGHRFVADLHRNGVLCFLITAWHKSFESLKGGQFILVKDSLAALQLLAAHHRTQVDIPVVGITGSNGKTVVKEWLNQCLQHRYQVTRSPKSYNSQVGVPLSVLQLMKRTEIAIFEAGISQPGEMEKLEKIIYPSIGIFTNLGQAHQENFLSHEEKAKEKLKLFDHAETLVYCLDHKPVSDIVDQKIKENEGLTRVTWGKSQQADVCYQVMQTGEGTTIITFTYNGKSETVYLPFVDDASIENAMHVITTLCYLGFDGNEIKTRIGSLTPVEMRLELLHGINNCTLINDAYNSDLHSLKIALDFLAAQHRRKSKALVLSDIYQSGYPDIELYRRVGSMIEKYSIERFVGVGPALSNFKQHFSPQATFYKSTDHLIGSGELSNLHHATLLFKGSRAFAFERLVHSMAQKQHRTVLEINLDNLVHNLNYFRGLLAPGTKVMVMVKALSYGSGTLEIAHALQHQQVDYLGVAYADEGVTLRGGGIRVPIMVMSPGDEDLDHIMQYNLEPEVHNLSSVERLINMVRNKNISHVPVHVKLDTGMHRLGFCREELDELIGMLRKEPRIKIRSVLSHLSASDDPKQDSFTREQISEFNTMYTRLCQAVQIKPLRHMANSAAIERFPQAHFEMVRLGIGLHGISAVGERLKAVSSLKSTITQVKWLSAGETVGYNRRGS
jgi:alanine racemase